MSLNSMLAETSFSSPIMTATSDYADTMDWSPTYTRSSADLTYPCKPLIGLRGGYDNELGRTLSFHRRRKEGLRQLDLRGGSVKEEELARKRKRLLQEGEDSEDVRDVLVTDALKA